ncbi:MAG TPA: outer membrane lipoprotein-sorting protein, partial [Atribacterota bacterium]|nr:outer membrane lipoprotein-sorting protein [Atribacterota bacterium]
SKFLKRNDNLWMFFPDAEEIVKISGHMLEQGFMGSDFSYQDMMESDKLTELYAFSLLEDDSFGDRPCYVLEATALPDRKVSYYRRVTWVDKERFVGLKEELYAQSGRLLKVSEVEKVEEIDGRWLPTQSIMENRLRKNTYTQFIINKIELNIELDEKMFSLQSLY